MNGDARALEIDGVSKRYGDLVALENLSVAIRAGELFGFVGRNGAGKTTTMRIVLGVLAADAGEVRWAGAALDFATRRRIGYMPEERGLYPKMRCLEQLVYLAGLHGMGEATAREAGRRWLERFELAERQDDELQALSMGNQQRMQLAAALAFEPEILVVDEPFAGLDPVPWTSCRRCSVSAPTPACRSSSRATSSTSSSASAIGWRSSTTAASWPPERSRSSDAAAPSDGGSMSRRRPRAGRTRSPGPTVAQKDGSRVLLELTGATDDQAILRAALEAGPVQEFRRAEPSLVELFRDVISEGRA